MPETRGKKNELKYLILANVLIYDAQQDPLNNRQTNVTVYSTDSTAAIVYKACSVMNREM